MQILFHKINTTEASITIKIETADYQDRVSKRIKAYSKKVNLKGFRLGSIPTSVIQQMYGRSILVEEINSLLAESLVQYLKEHEIQILGEPIPVLDKMEAIDWEHQHDFELEYIVGIVPPFTCALSKDIQVKAYEISHVTDQTIDTLVTQLRKAHGTTEAVTQSTDHDIVYGELHYPMQQFKTRMKISVAALPGEVRKLFIALSPQDQVSLDIKQLLQDTAKPPEFTEKMHATMLKLGGPATFTVETIHRLFPAAVEQPFFNKVFQQESVSTEQDFRDKLRARLLQHKQQEANVHLDQSLQALLLKQAAIVLPENFMKYWPQSKHKIPKEQESMYSEQYAREIRWRLLVEALSKAHNIQVTHEEIVDEVRNYLQASFESNAVAQPPSEENISQLLQGLIQQHNGEYYKKVHERVHMRKLINFIKGEVTIINQEISVEEFDNLALK